MLSDIAQTPYLAIYLAAMIEGEVVFVLASVLVAAGRLDALGVVLCGALGAATGDQFYFYLFRGALWRWLTRRPAIRLSSSRRTAILERVRNHQSAMILALRFAPGLRIAIAAACAWADVSAVRFSVLNGLSAVVWAAGLLFLVARVGPAVLEHLGLHGMWALAVPGILVLAFGWWLGRDLSAGGSQGARDLSPDGRR